MTVGHLVHYFAISLIEDSVADLFEDYHMGVNRTRPDQPGHLLKRL